MKFILTAGQLALAGDTLIEKVADSLVLAADQTGAGTFLELAATSASWRHEVVLGEIAGMARFMACIRLDPPFWMQPRMGEASALGGLGREIQSFMGLREDGRCVLIVPLTDGKLRWSLCAAGAPLPGKPATPQSRGLRLVGESGDGRVVSRGGIACFIAVGDDPYALCASGARAVRERLKTGRLRSEKRIPDFASQLGWCTWDAFYSEVSHEKMREGLESFRAGGLVLPWVILDDGWQQVGPSPTGETRLTGLGANDKFPGGLGPTVRMAKDEFGVRTFFVWHAITGYWGGLDGAALPAYEVTDKLRHYSPDVYSYKWHMELHWGPVVGAIPRENVARFYEDYHASIRAMGVDGVKIDNQASIEGLCEGEGGRLANMQRYREAIEGAAGRHFEDRVLHCMGCSNDLLMSCDSTSIYRTSTDFWPNDPASHGLHLAINAYVGVWFGEFILPDWDMFQSGHAMGAFHAAGRAVSGSPVYVSDKVGEHNFALLRSLCLSDGTVPRPDGVGRPSPDCLFRDPVREDVLLKVFNRNRDAAVVGVFNCRHRPAGAAPLVSLLSTADVPGLDASKVICWLHRARTLQLLDAGQTVCVELADLDWEIATLVPVDEGVAPIGLIEKLNPGGCISGTGWQDEAYIVNVKDGGSLGLWCARSPAVIMIDGRVVKFEYAVDSGLLVIPCELGRSSRVSLTW